MFVYNMLITNGKYLFEKHICYQVSQRFTATNNLRPSYSELFFRKNSAKAKILYKGNILFFTVNDFKIRTVLHLDNNIIINRQ